MTPAEIADLAGNLSVAGIFGVMWWTERKDRLKADEERRNMDDKAKALASIIEDARADRETMVGVVREHTAVVATLTAKIEEWNKRPCLNYHPAQGGRS